MFVIEESETGLALNFTYHLPKFKQSQNIKLVQSQFDMLGEALRLKVKKLVLLREISEK